MVNHGADWLRDRDSGELLDEQKQLEQLKRITLLEQRAWWEWDAEACRFNVSGEWEKLTGYKADEVFPSDINPNVGIESMLGRLCDRWLSFVSEEDKPRAKEQIENFILFNNSDNSFEHGYHFRMANGSYRLLLTTARSVWRDGRLINLFAQTRDIEQWTLPGASATAIVKNSEAVKRTENQISEIIKQTSGMAPFIKTVVPGLIGIALSTITAISANIIPIRRELYKLTQNWHAPLTVEEAMSNTAESLFFEKLDDETIALAASLLTEYGFYGESIRLAAYDDPTVPKQIQYLLQASKEPVYSASQLPKSISSSTDISRRAEDHVSGQTNWIEDGVTSRFSVAFSVTTDSLEQQLFVIEIFNSETVPEAKKSAIESATKELTANMKSLLDNASAL